MEIRIDTETCIGSGNCCFLAPDSFDLDDAGQAIVLDPEATPPDKLASVAEGCPVGAISIWLDGVRIDKGRP